MLSPKHIQSHGKITKLHQSSSVFVGMYQNQKSALLTTKHVEETPSETSESSRGPKMHQPLPYTSIISINFIGLFMLPPVKVKDMDGHGTCQATTLLLWLPPVGGKRFDILVKLSQSMTASGFKFANISGNTSRRFHPRCS